MYVHYRVKCSVLVETNIPSLIRENWTESSHIHNPHSLLLHDCLIEHWTQHYYLLLWCFVAFNLAFVFFNFQHNHHHHKVALFNYQVTLLYRLLFVATAILKTGNYPLHMIESISNIRLLIARVVGCWLRLGFIIGWWTRYHDEYNIRYKCVMNADRNSHIRIKWYTIYIIDLHISLLAPLSVCPWVYMYFHINKMVCVVC